MRASGSTPTRPQFTDVAHAAGVDFLNRPHYPAASKLTNPCYGLILYGGPAASPPSDFDSDGFHDLLSADGVSSPGCSATARRYLRGCHRRLRPRRASTASRWASSPITTTTAQGPVRQPDFRPNQLFHNGGDGTFTDVTARSGIGEDCCTTVASWGDYDNDGYLDLYVGRYLDPRKKIPTTFYARNGERNQLYHNNGDGTFTNVTGAAGVGDTGPLPGHRPGGTTTTTATPTSTSPTTSAAGRSTTTSATARSPTSPSRPAPWPTAPA